MHNNSRADGKEGRTNIKVREGLSSESKFKTKITKGLEKLDEYRKWRLFCSKEKDSGRGEEQWNSA